MRRTRVSAAIAVCLVLAGCRAQPKPRRADAGARAARAPVADAFPVPVLPEPPARPADAGLHSVHLDAPADIGPSTPLAGTPTGALIRTKPDDLISLAFERPKTTMAAEPIDADAISAIPAPAIARGSRAYWISHGRLVRRDFAGSGAGIVNAGPLQVIATDAFDATRVAVRTIPGPTPRDLVAYIARPAALRGDRRARVWLENGADQDAAAPAGRSFVLSEDGAGASSVALAGISARTWAVSLDARIAMSPVHARTIDVGDGNAIRFGEDVVVFVGEAEGAHTEIDLTVASGEPAALVPLPRDAGSFGLALVAFGREPRLDSPARWTMYPNGIKPALVALAELCGEEWVAYTRPTESAPDTPKLLVLAPIHGHEIGPETPVATAMRFASIALAPGADAAATKRRAGWVVWSADGKSRASAIRCK